MTENICMPKNIVDWQHFLNNVNPNIMKLGLERVRAVAHKMGVDDFGKTKIVTVAGTNGKGSTATMLASILESAGIKTGLYTSPHILRFSERIICGGLEASNDDLCNAFEKVYANQDFADPLTFFEFTTLAALSLFKESACEVLVLEVGLGGRLDAVNILDADIAIIPSIGLDHCQLLGNTLADIAAEKAGIIKSSTTATIIGDLPKEALAVISDKVAGFHGVLHQLGKSLQVEWTSPTSFNMLNPIPLNNLVVPSLPLINAPLSVAAALLLRIAFKYHILDNDIITGLEIAKLQGRFEQISTNPSITVDVAHNPPAAAYLHKCIISRGEKRRLAVVGMLKDKDISRTLLNVVGDFERFYVCTLPGPRGADKNIITKTLKALGVSEDNIVSFDNVIDAYEIACCEILQNADLYVFGSFLTVEQVLKYEGERRKSTLN